MRKRSLALALIALIVLPLMTACSGSPAATTAPANNAPAPTASAPVKIVAFCYPHASYQPSDQDVLDYIKNKIQAETNVICEVIMAPMDGTEATTKLNTMLAAKEQVDVLAGTAYQTLQRNGMLQDIGPSLEKYGQDAVTQWGPGAMKKMTTPDGKVWGIPRMDNFVTYPVWVRQDWLDKAGLKVPTSIEELTAVLDAFKKGDYAGGGQTIPMLHNSIGDLNMCLLGAFTQYGQSVWPDGDKVKPYYLQPGFKDYLTQLNAWYKAGYLDKEAFSWKTNQVTDAIKQNRAGSTVIWYSRVTLNEKTLKDTVAPDANYVIAPIVGPAGKAETVGMVSSLSTSGYLVTAQCKNPDAAVKVINWGYAKPENLPTSIYGEQGKGWKWATDGKDGVFDILKVQNGHEYYDLYKGIATEAVYRENASPNPKHIEYINGKEILNLGRAKSPYDINVAYNAQEWNDNTQAFMTDINTVLDQYLMKFVTGETPLTDFDKFLSDLDKAGMQKLIDEYTRQYNTYLVK